MEVFEIYKLLKSKGIFFFYLLCSLSFLSPRRLPQLTAAIDLVNEISKQLTERKNQAVTEISNTFDELEKALHQRKTALITEVENICTTKQKVSGLPSPPPCKW